MAQEIDIAYAAHTAVCTFLLDGEGICRRIVMIPKGKRRESSRTAVKCVGAQYVASLDGSAAGGLVEMPRVGASMLFARVDDRGRVSLVRTGAVTSFESLANEDPFLESQSVETSAPILDDLQTPRTNRVVAREPNYFDPSERTQRIPALRAEDCEDDENELGNDLATAEYQSLVPGSYPSPAASAPVSRHGAETPVRPTLPSQPPAVLPTLRKPPMRDNLDDSDTFARPPPSKRGVLPRRHSDGKVRAASNAARAWPAPEPAAPPAYASDVQVKRRRDG